MFPAFPVEFLPILAEILLGICSSLVKPAPSIDTVSVASIVMLPAVPCPDTDTSIKPLPERNKFVVSMTILPELLVFSVFTMLEMLLDKTPEVPSDKTALVNPSILIVSTTLMLMSPPSASPETRLWRFAPFVIVKFCACKLMFPTVPAASSLEKLLIPPLEFPTPSNTISPVALIEISPVLPCPLLKLAIAPLLTKETLRALISILPALPVPKLLLLITVLFSMPLAPSKTKSSSKLIVISPD